MDNTSLQNLLKRLCKVMWESNVTDPLTYVTQIAYLLFLKLLEETDTEQRGNGAKERRELFSKVTLNGQDVDFSKLRWSVLTSHPDNERMLLRDRRDRESDHRQHGLRLGVWYRRIPYCRVWALSACQHVA
jgi:hypothetical protein